MAKRIITVSNEELLIEADSTNLSAVANSGATSLSTYSISKFAINQPIQIGEFGGEDSEISSTSASVAPSGSTITLASPLAKTHPADVKVYILPYNQVEFSYSDTVAGAKTVLATNTIDVEKMDTTYADSGVSGSGFYFTRYYNSLNSSFADYSDPIPYGGFASNTVGFIIETAMKESGKDFTDKLTYDILISEINSCLRFVRGKLKRWNNYQKFNAIIGTTVLNQTEYPLPTDYYDNDSEKSMLDIRIDSGHDSLLYADKQEFNTMQENPSTGLPTYFTVYEGVFAIYPQASSIYSSLNIYADYYTDISEVKSNGDIINMDRFDLIKHWLMWVIRSITERNGKKDMTDPDWQMFQTILADAIRRESSGQKFPMKPKVSGINYRGLTTQSYDDYLKS